MATPKITMNLSSAFTGNKTLTKQSSISFNTKQQLQITRSTTRPPARASPPLQINALFGKSKKAAAATKEPKNKQVQYGNDWYAATRDGGRKFRTTREEIEYRREANRIANNGKDRKDLYTDNWDGDKYKGSPVNVLTVIAAVSILAPLVGLVFAYTTYGDLWG